MEDQHQRGQLDAQQAAAIHPIIQHKTFLAQEDLEMEDHEANPRDPGLLVLAPIDRRAERI
jgi:hypothetical protein